MFNLLYFSFQTLYNDIKVFGCCPECGETVTDEMSGVYVDNEGRYYCCLDCALSYNGITELEF